MKRALLLMTVVLAGCDPLFGESCMDDPNANHFALNPQNGACWEFASSCDVPSSWQPCGASCTTSSDCAAGQTCASGTCVGQMCSADPDCPASSYCVNGTCVLGSGSCGSDDDCALTDHCDTTHTPRKTPAGGSDIAVRGICLPNAACNTDSDCMAGQWCDTGAGDRTSGGVCSRGVRPAGSPCVSNGDCGSGQICPAQYGGCSPPPSGGGVPAQCTSDCEPTCTMDADCATGLHCNNNVVCGVGNPKPTAPRSSELVPVQCQGWCLP